MGAINGSSIVTDKLLADYYKGRCLIASLPVLAADPSFHSSAFALVPKKDKPLCVDGRIIHDLSAPAGVSVNDLTDSSASPDATWDPFTSIALRICDLRRRYPGYAIYAMVADIADAFHHVPVHAHHASAFGGKLPRSSHGIISGMAVFGWTSSPGFFAVFGKAVRHYQRTGASRVKGFIEPFWIFQWVDDIVLIEVDIDDRLQKAEKRLRDGVKLVFGMDGWHEGKFTTWSRIFHAVGIDWNIPAEFITVPQRKVDKTHKALADVLGKPFVSMKQLDSLTPKDRSCGVIVLQKDLVWWKDLVFQNEFAGIPMRLLDRNRAMDEIWLVQIGQQGIVVTSMALRERVLVVQSNSTEQDTTVAATLSRVTTVWGPRLEVDNAWRHISIHNDRRWITRIIDKMNCRTTERQEALRQCALNQAQYRLHFSTHTFGRNMEQTSNCDVHIDTNPSNMTQMESEDSGSKRRLLNSSERQSLRAHSDGTAVWKSGDGN
ncbi:hypothetical protein PR001_g13164 [Phytophthora rubi]|uniref:Reverse transcriptase domain-containing protein n=1 Tax=Phytophthora rubi TaxID=129364 RepID=A0A6A3KVJ4_9STRA|nr:hypothetical protein PR002_g16097 [Phytophthora rubi]KAE9022362.1 hypothetical protein PR001_g13164 [Phytophthora rubi]